MAVWGILQDKTCGDVLMRLHWCKGAMRAEDRQQKKLFLHASFEDVVPADHSLRPIRALVEEALRRPVKDWHTTC